MSHCKQYRTVAIKIKQLIQNLDDTDTVSVETIRRIIDQELDGITIHKRSVHRMILPPLTRDQAARMEELYSIAIATERKRIDAVGLVSNGWTVQQAAERVGLDAVTVHKAIKRFQQQGPDGLVHAKRRNCTKVPVWKKEDA